MSKIKKKIKQDLYTLSQRLHECQEAGKALASNDRTKWVEYCKKYGID